ncbi:hypothetical protein BKA93DRAFT_771913 [Sparassis latifolia]
MSGKEAISALTHNMNTAWSLYHYYHCSSRQSPGSPKCQWSYSRCSDIACVRKTRGESHPAVITST